MVGQVIRVVAAECRPVGTEFEYGVGFHRPRRTVEGSATDQAVGVYQCSGIEIELHRALGRDTSSDDPTRVQVHGERIIHGTAGDQERFVYIQDAAAAKQAAGVEMQVRISGVCGSVGHIDHSLHPGGSGTVDRGTVDQGEGSRIIEKGAIVGHRDGSADGAAVIEFKCTRLHVDLSLVGKEPVDDRGARAGRLADNAARMVGQVIRVVATERRAIGLKVEHGAGLHCPCRIIECTASDQAVGVDERSGIEIELHGALRRDVGADDAAGVHVDRHRVVDRAAGDEERIVQFQRAVAPKRASGIQLQIRG